MERCSRPGAPQEPHGESREEPEEHKRSHNLLYWKKKVLTDIVVGGEIDEKTAYIQSRSSMARALEINEKARQAEGEAEVV